MKDDRILVRPNQKDDGLREESGNGKKDGIVEEARKAKGKKVGKKPSRAEVEDHNLTHIPFRSWCAHCVKGRAVADPHWDQGSKEEEEIPTVSADYMYMKKKKEEKDGQEEEEEAEGMPTLAMYDRKSKWAAAHVVPQKGVHRYAVERMDQEVKIMGYNRLILKMDTERSLQALRNAVIEENKREIIVEDTPKGESASNGEVEGAVRRVQGQARSIRDGLEARYEVKFQRDHVLIP